MLKDNIKNKIIEKADMIAEILSSSRNPDVEIRLDGHNLKILEVSKKVIK